MTTKTHSGSIRRRSTLGQSASWPTWARWLLRGRFEELHDGLEALKLKGVGPLVTHDTAYRFGAKLGLEPRLVYLHSGTLEGAVLLGFSKRCRTLEPEQL